MNERVRRPILHLKLGSTPPTERVGERADEAGMAPRPEAPAAPTPAATYTWKCRPCGTPFVPPGEGPDEEPVRCPACNARLGRAGDFRLDPPPLDKLRARAVKAPPAPAPAVVRPPRSPRTTPPVVMVKVLKKVR